MTLLTGTEAIAALIRAGDEDEQSRSSYWREEIARVDPETGAGPLGNFSPQFCCPFSNVKRGAHPASSGIRNVYHFNSSSAMTASATFG